ncbi:hypothetical protein BAXH7_03393 [Bacillus amyloliquefaciens XH7]|nr:hypothetical protein BAXH7_03393 [Bacillus amyloliquefaciens XH7]KYC99323.1 hypothetical protein B425_3804 [Bacillus amyloliquefaciens]
MLAALTAPEDGSFLPLTIPFTSAFKFPVPGREHAEGEKFKKIPYLLLKSSGKSFKMKEEKGFIFFAEKMNDYSFKVQGG